MGIQGYNTEKAFCVNHPLTKTLVLLTLSEKSVDIFFFEFLKERSPTFECVLHDDGGPSKAHIARHSSPTPLVYVGV